MVDAGQDEIQAWVEVEMSAGRESLKRTTWLVVVVGEVKSAEHSSVITVCLGLHRTNS